MINIDLENGWVAEQTAEGEIRFGLNTPQAFNLISRAWLRCGWDNKYVYSFTWLGRPIIQLPEDIIRFQEVIYRIQPDVLIETGIAHGGSLVFYASLFKAIGKGRVVGVDIDIRPQNRAAIAGHPLIELITLIEGSSTDANIVDAVCREVKPGDTVMVMLDSNHSRDHVLRELEAYAPLVTPGSYIVAADGIMSDLAGAPRTQPDWSWNNPKEAVRQFIANHPEFIQDTPVFAFNEGNVSGAVTYWPNAWLKRVA